MFFIRILFKVLVSTCDIVYIKTLVFVKYIGETWGWYTILKGIIIGSIVITSSVVIVKYGNLDFMNFSGTLVETKTHYPELSRSITSYDPSPGSESSDTADSAATCSGSDSSGYSSSDSNVSNSSLESNSTSESLGTDSTFSRGLSASKAPDIFYDPETGRIYLHGKEEQLHKANHKLIAACLLAAGVFVAVLLVWK